MPTQSKPPHSSTGESRVVSLLPSATEMVACVGAANRLVGVSHECDYPPEVIGLPVLTRARCSSSNRSGKIDRSVREVVRSALAVYHIDVELLGELNPDVVVTQDLCDVCAVSYDDVLSAVQTLTNQDVQIINLSPLRFSDIFDDILRVGDGLGVRDTAERARAELEARVEDVKERSSHATHRPTVLSIEWIDPVMAGGTWMPELIEMAGGEALVTRPGDHAPTLEFDQLEALEPDMVLIKPCGFDIERTTEELFDLERLLPWRHWTCVSKHRVFLTDGNQYFNRPGPRIVDSLEIMAACIHPEIFPDFVGRYRDVIERILPNLSTEPFEGR
jgi:iron complex transport system substrate-binding protein